MSSQGFFLDTYDRVSRVVGMLLNESGSGIALSIDVGGSFFDLIASNAAGAAGQEFVQAPSLLRYRSQLWDNRFTSRASDILAEPVMFGRADGKLQTIDEAGVLRGYVMSGGDVSTRSLDSWIVGRAPLRFIHFGDTSHALDQIEGARGTLARDRPIVTTYPTSSSKSELLSAFATLGYVGYNLELRPLTQESIGNRSDFGWIFLPDEVCGVVDDLSFTGDDATGPERRVLDLYATVRQRRSVELFGIHTVEPPQLGRTIPISDIVCCNDCYRVESDGTLSWRWLGPRPRSRIAVPCAFPGAYAFELDVFKCRMKDGLQDCRIFVEGRETSTSVEGVERGKIRFAGYLDAEQYEGFVSIDIISPGTLPYIGSDRRILRTSISSIAASLWH